MYYIQQDDNIVLFDIDRQRLEGTLKFTPQYKGLEIQETEEGYTIVDFQLITIEKAEQEAQEKERERVMKLHMTPLDFLKALIKIGITYETVKQIMEANPEVEMEMKFCQNVYRGHPMIEQFAQQFGVSDETLDYIFKKANGEEE